MGTVTVSRLDNLFWLGRYIERVYRLIMLYMEGYDRMIDNDGEYYIQICEHLGIPNDYTSTEDFTYRFAYDNDNCYSIIANAYRAYDNAMVMRDEISSQALSYIHLAISELEKAKTSASPIYNLQKVLDNILAFWGCMDDEIDDEAVRNTAKTGKRIERLDLYLRSRKPSSELVREVDRLTGRIVTTPLKYNRGALKHVAAMVEDEPLDYSATLSMLLSVFA